MLNFVIKQLERLSKRSSLKKSIRNKTVVRSEAHSIETIKQGLSRETFPLEKIKLNPINVD